jgi:hypothetical protein
LLSVAGEGKFPHDTRRIERSKSPFLIAPDLTDPGLF